MSIQQDPSAPFDGVSTHHLVASHLNDLQQLQAPHLPNRLQPSPNPGRPAETQLHQHSSTLDPSVTAPSAGASRQLQQQQQQQALSSQGLSQQPASNPQTSLPGPSHPNSHPVSHVDRSGLSQASPATDSGVHPSSSGLPASASSMSSQLPDKKDVQIHRPPKKRKKPTGGYGFIKKADSNSQAITRLRMTIKKKALYMMKRTGHETLLVFGTYGSDTRLQVERTGRNLLSREGEQELRAFAAELLRKERTRGNLRALKWDVMTKAELLHWYRGLKSKLWEYATAPDPSAQQRLQPFGIDRPTDLPSTSSAQQLPEERLRLLVSKMVSAYLKIYVDPLPSVSNESEEEDDGNATHSSLPLSGSELHHPTAPGGPLSGHDLGSFRRPDPYHVDSSDPSARGLYGSPFPSFPLGSSAPGNGLGSSPGLGPIPTSRAHHHHHTQHNLHHFGSHRGHPQQQPQPQQQHSYSHHPHLPQSHHRTSQSLASRAHQALNPLPSNSHSQSYQLSQLQHQYQHHPFSRQQQQQQPQQQPSQPSSQQQPYNNSLHPKKTPSQHPHLAPSGNGAAGVASTNSVSKFPGSSSTSHTLHSLPPYPAAHPQSLSLHQSHIPASAPASTSSAPASTSSAPSSSTTTSGLQHTGNQHFHPFTDSQPPPPHNPPSQGNNDAARAAAQAATLSVLDNNSPIPNFGSGVSGNHDFIVSSSSSSSSSSSISGAQFPPTYGNPQQGTSRLPPAPSAAVSHPPPFQQPSFSHHNQPYYMSGGTSQHPPSAPSTSSHHLYHHHHPSSTSTSSSQHHTHHLQHGDVQDHPLHHHDHHHDDDQGFLGPKFDSHRSPSSPSSSPSSHLDDLNSIDPQEEEGSDLSSKGPPRKRPKRE